MTAPSDPTDPPPTLLERWRRAVVVLFRWGPPNAPNSVDVIEGTVTGEAPVSFEAPRSSPEGASSEAPSVRFALTTDAGDVVRVRGRPTLAGPLDEGRVVLTPGQRVVVEGSVELGLTSDGYRGPTEQVPVAIEARAIGVGPEGQSWLDEERSRRARDVAVDVAVDQTQQELRARRESLRRFLSRSRALRLNLSLTALLALGGLVLAATEMPAPTIRYALFGGAVLLGYLCCLEAYLVVVRPEARAMGVRRVLFLFLGPWLFYCGLNVSGGAVDWAQRAMLGLVAGGPLTVGLMWVVEQHPAMRRVPWTTFRAHRWSVALPMFIAALFGYHNVSQIHDGWTVRVISDAGDSQSLLGACCQVSLSWSPAGTNTQTGQCEVDVECPSYHAFGGGLGRGFVRCVVTEEGYFGDNSYYPDDPDGSISLDGYDGVAGRVTFERVD